MPRSLENVMKTSVIEDWKEVAEKDAPVAYEAFLEASKNHTFKRTENAWEIFLAGFMAGGQSP